MGTASFVVEKSPGIRCILLVPAAFTFINVSSVYEVGCTEVAGTTLLLAQVMKEKCKMLAEK